jgi:hypothetical protein
LFSPCSLFSKYLKKTELLLHRFGFYAENNTQPLTNQLFFSTNEEGIPCKSVTVPAAVIPMKWSNTKPLFGSEPTGKALLPRKSQKTCQVNFPDAFGLKSREWMHFYPHLVSDISLRYCFSTF